MPPALATDPILKRFRAALDEIYGDRLERVVLFGSKARGDAGEDSDYDIAVFLKDLKEGDLDTRGGSWTGWPICAAPSCPTPKPSSTPSRTRPAPTEIKPRSWARSAARHRSVTAPEVSEHLVKARDVWPARASSWPPASAKMPGAMRIWRDFMRPRPSSARAPAGRQNAPRRASHSLATRTQ